MTAHSLQSVVDDGFAPSVRWLATGIKEGRIPGRMVGRYWKTWLMTDQDLTDFLEGTRSKPQTAVIEVKEQPSVGEPDIIVAGLSARAARRLRRAS